MQKLSRVLIVEDEREMAELLCQALTEYGYDCKIAENGAKGLQEALSVDLIVADVMMPQMNGFAMVRELRERQIQVPVILLTAKDATKDIVSGLEAGADDYLVKPFKLEELLARVKSQLRRAREFSQVLQWEDLTMDCEKRAVRRGDVEIFLSATEFDLLKLFLRFPEQAISKQTILREVWHDTGGRASNIVELYIAYLRRKTEVRGCQRLIQTVKGKGYVLATSYVEP